jgi:toxin YhaV
MVVNGWALFVHPLFTGQLERLRQRVQQLAAKAPYTYEHEPAATLLATIRKYILEIIPKDPNAPEFRQGNTLGEDNRHWFRAKFHERYRLFYRFSSKHKVIIYAWMNDENSLRKAESKTDPYAIFQSMLAGGNPPSDLAELIAAAKKLPQAAPAKGKSRKRK